MVPGQKEARKVVPYSKHKSKCLINPFASHPYKGATDRHKDCHFCHAVIDCRKKEAVESEGNEQRARSALHEAAANADEERGADRTPNGYHLDLSRSKMSLKTVNVLDDNAIFSVSHSELWHGFLNRGALLFTLVFDFFHDSCWRLVSKLLGVEYKRKAGLELPF